MKIKVKPEDFIVREQSDLTLSAGKDRYAVYALTKRSWDTFDLLDYLARRLHLARQDISVGGIKDRFGHTEQLISVRAGGDLPGRLQEGNFSLELRGYAAAPVTARAVVGNRFTITVRDIDPRLEAGCLAATEAVRIWGLPNYYDEQRFGSARHGRGFMGKELFLGHRERALRLYFTPSRHDDRRTRVLKSRVFERWGHWAECLEPAFGDYRRVLEYLAGHRGAFTRALALLDRRYLVFVLNAYQSYLYNQILSGYLQRLAEQRGLDLLERAWRWGSFLFYQRLPEDLSERLRVVQLPVPGYDSLLPDPEIRAITEEVLRREGLTLTDLKVRQLSRLEVHGRQRGMIVVPGDLQVCGMEADELYPGRRRLTLDFSLPRGSYATLIVKRLQAVPWRANSLPSAGGRPGGDENPQK
jgi:tRNA pseudouridine13 synthase